MKFRYLLMGFAVLTMVSLVPMVKAQDPFTYEDTIEPGGTAAVPLVPISETESMDITITSDVPLTVYIIDSTEDYEAFYAISDGDFENFTEYEQKYEDVTDKKITQDYDSDNYYWVLMYNPSETDTAEVEVEYEFFEDMAGEIVEDAVSDSCCGSAIAAGILGTIGILAGIMIIRRK